MRLINWLWIGLILLYLFPAFIQPNFYLNDRIKDVVLALPRILSGDEPHYLAATYSLSKDLDLELKNNYGNAFRGYCDLGYNFKFKKTLGHVRYMLSGQDFNSILFKGIVLRPEFKNIDFNIFSQLPFHPSGLPIFISIFLWPLKDSCYLEIGAVFFSVFLSILGLFCLYKTLIYYKKDVKSAFLITFLVAIGTTLGFYSKTYFTEPYITVFLLSAYYLFIVRKQTVLPAIFLGIGATMKYPAVIFPLGFCFFLLLNGQIRRLIRFGIVVSIFDGAILFLNYSLYGHLFSQGYTYGNLLAGMFGIIFSPTRGILPFAPFLIFSILGIGSFYRQYKKEALLTFVLILSYYLFIASFHGWWGGGFASRNMVPILPLLGIILYFWYTNNKNKLSRYIFYFLAALSVFINFQTSFFHFAFWIGKPPWQLFYLIAYKLPRILFILGFK